MSISDKEFIKLCEVKRKYFRDFCRYLQTCKRWTNKSDAEKFVDLYGKETTLHKFPKQKYVCAGYDNNPLAQYLEIKKAAEKDKDNLIDILAEKKSKHFFFKFSDHLIEEIKIQDKAAFKTIKSFCSMIEDFYALIRDNKTIRNADNLQHVENFALNVYGKAQELIGYWTSKLEKAEKPYNKNKAVGLMTREIIEGQLTKLCGGYGGYKKLGHGQKQEIIEQISHDALVQERTVFRHIKKLEQLNNEN